jgi:hypothetical protein
MSILIHRRTYECEAFTEGDDAIRVRGHLTDTKPHGLCLADGRRLVIHEMTIDLIVSVPSFEIIDVGTSMEISPYRACQGILADYRQLIGTSISRGYTHRVREMFGGPKGCSHMGALLQAMGPVAVQASWSLMNLHVTPEDRLGDDDLSPAERERRMRLNLNTCHIWAEDSEQMALVQIGRRPRRPGWEVDRLRELGVEVPADESDH